MANGHDKLIKLHANLVKDGYELPEFKVFQTDMADSNKLIKLHSNLLKDGYELPDANTFRDDMGYGVKKKEDIFGASALGLVSKTGGGGGGAVGRSKVPSKETQLIDGVEVGYSKQAEPITAEPEYDAPQFDEDDPIGSATGIALSKMRPIKVERKEPISTTAVQKPLQSRDEPIEQLSEGMHPTDVIDEIRAYENYFKHNTNKSLAHLFKRTGLSVNQLMDENYDELIRSKLKPGNTTDAITYERLKDARNVNQAINSSFDVEEMAVNYAAKNNPQIQRQLEIGTIRSLSDETRGRLTYEFLINNATQQQFQSTGEGNIKYQEAKYNFLNKFPKFSKVLIGSVISQKMEDMGMNNGMLNIVTKEEADKVVDKLVEEGNFSLQEKHFYENELRDNLGLTNFGRKILGKEYIDTPGAFENVLETGREGFENIPKGVYEGSGLRRLLVTEKEIVKDDLRRADSRVDIRPKGVTHEITQAASQFLGQSFSIGAGGGFLQSVKAVNNPRKAMALIGGAQAYASYIPQARELFPGNPLKQSAFAGVLAGFEMATENIFNDRKIVDAITGKIRPTVFKSIQDFTNKNISELDVKRNISDKIAQAIRATPKAAKYFSKAVFQNEIEEVSAQLGTQITKVPFMGISLNEALDGEELMQTAKMALLGSPFIAILATKADMQRDVSALSKEMIYEMASDPNQWKHKIQEAAKLDGAIAVDAINKIDNLDYVAKVKEIVDKNNNLSEQAKVDFVFNSLKQKITEETKKEIPDKTLAKEYDAKSKVLEVDQERILNPEMTNTEYLEKLHKAEGLPKSLRIMLSDEKGKFAGNPTSVGEAVKFVAQQINNLDAEGKPETTTGKKKSTDDYPEVLIQIAKQRYPEYFEKSIEAEEIDVIPDLTNAVQMKSRTDVERSQSAGDRMFVVTEQDENPFEVLDISILNNYAPDQIYALPPTKQGSTEQAPVEDDVSNLRNAKTKDEIDKAILKATQSDNISDALQGAENIIGKAMFKAVYYSDPKRFANELADSIEKIAPKQKPKDETTIPPTGAENKQGNVPAAEVQPEPPAVNKVVEPAKGNEKAPAEIPVKAKGKLEKLKEKRKPKVQTAAEEMPEKETLSSTGEDISLEDVLKPGNKFTAPNGDVWEVFELNDGKVLQVTKNGDSFIVFGAGEINNPKLRETLDFLRYAAGKVDAKEPAVESKQPPKKPTKQGARKVRDEKLLKELDAAWDEFTKDSGLLTSGGLDPRKIEQGTKLIGLYMKAGVYKFSDILEDAYGKFGEKLHEFMDALKSVYSTYYNTKATDQEAAKMDASVRGVKLADVINRIENGLPPKILKDETPVNEVRAFVDAIKAKISAKEKLSIVAIRKIAVENGIEAVDTELQEMVELGIVELAREIGTSNKSLENRYKEIVELYNNQPTISMRSSERIDKQQYSTPIPMSFLMGQFVNQGNPATVLEPNAGNGMLTVGIPASKVIANEIDPVRLRMLSEQGFRMVTDQDATMPFPFKVDGVIMNPPFGGKPAVEFDGVPISGLDEQMVASALRSLNPKGKAAIIIGGHNTYDEKGRLKADRVFLNFLYSRYNVVDIINVDGSLYSKQGTSFPTRIILINGVKPAAIGNAPLEDKQANEPITDFSDLYNRIQNVKQNENINKTPGVQTGVDAGTVTGDAVYGGSAKLGGKDKTASVGSRTAKDQLLDSTRDKSRGETTPSNRGYIDDLSGAISAGERQFDGSNNADRALDQSAAEVSTGQQPAVGNIQARGDRPVQPSIAVPISDRTISILNEKAKYEPKSKGKSVDTVMPSQMATETYHTLDAITEIYGDIDDFVRTELGYKTNQELFKALSAEQVDAVAIAIHQLKTGQGMVIGDMTGVGKGRIAAAIIRYAVNNGHKPIFLTEKVNLFSDLYRDMMAIGSHDLKPFIVNSKSAAGNPDITNPQGDVVHKSFSGNRKSAILNAAEIPGEFDFSVATYSQFRTAKDKPSIKRDFFLRTAQGNILIMDESHNASGESNAGELFQDLLPNTKGVVFLSATFAKRPDNMPIYAMKTAMSDANLSSEELVEAIRKGGVALQEVVAAQLVQSGQMIRRERTFEGVKVEYSVLDEFKDTHRKVADEFTEIVRDVIDFEKRYILPIISGMDTEMSAQQGKAEKRKGTQEAGVKNTPFASKTFQLINQMLFTIKAKEVAKAAIEAHKQGKKPVIAFLSTMESFLNHMGVTVGEKLQKADFALVMKRALEGTMKYTIDNGMGVKTPASLSLAELTPEGRRKYEELVTKIRGITSGISISPIDVMIKELTDAGLRVGEITGRSKYLEIHDDGSSTVTERKDKDINKTSRAFNSGEIDVILLNASGATGLSLHSSVDFKDQRPRVLISGQLELDINKEIQKRGRVDRTGQVHRAEYQYVVSSIPAEQRLLMMFKAKLKSLDANTTSSQKSKANDLELTDFLNKYGDEVVTQYVKDNTEFNERIMDPLKFLDKSEDELSEIKKVDNAASKITGRVAILPTKEQEVFYSEIIEAYTSYLNYLKDNNENDLEVKLLPLNAETKSTTEVIAGRGTNSPFGMPSVRETVEVDVLTKPMKKEEIDHDIKKALVGVTASEYKNNLLKELSEYEEGFIAVKVQKIEDSYLADIIPETIERATSKGKTEDEIEQIRATLADAMNKKIERERLKHQNTFSFVERTLRDFTIGDVFNIPTSTRVDTNTFFSKAVLIGVQVKEGSVNKYTPSNILLKFAVNDSRRTVTVPVSKVDYINAIMANSRYMEKAQVLKDWDSRISNKTRSTRYIITGNLLQAYGTNDGQLVAYTTKGGAIKKGMLLPDSYDPATQKLRTTISRAFKDGTDVVVSTDLEVRLERSRNGYSLTVPLSKQRGGKYFLNDRLRDLVEGGGFNQRGNQMQAYINEDKIRDVLLALDSLGVTVESEISSSAKPQIKETVSDDIKEMRDIVKDFVDAGQTDLNSLKNTIAEELDDNSSQLRDLVEDAYFEYSKESSSAPQKVTEGVIDRVREFVQDFGGGTTTVLDNEQQVKEAAAKISGVAFMKSGEGKILGFAHEGGIVLNGEQLNPNTPVHEAGHVWAAWASTNAPELHSRGMELVEGSRYLKNIKGSSAYQAQANKLPAAQRENYYKNEALAAAIGDKGAQFVLEAKKKGFLQWLNNLWDAIKKAAGFSGISNAELQNLTLDEFASRAAADILRGKPEVAEAPRDVSGIKKALVPQDVIDETNFDRIGDNELMRRGREIIASGKVKPQAVVSKIISEGKGVLTPEEVVALITYKRDIDNQLQGAYQKWNDAIAAGEGVGTAGVDITTLEDQIRDYQMMAVITAQQQSMSFRLRRKLLDSGFNIVKETLKYKKNNSGVIPADVLEKFQAADKKVKELQAALDKEREAFEKAEGERAIRDIQEAIDRERLMEEEIERRVSEGTESAVAGLYKSLPPQKKSYADRALAALDRIQKRLRGKAYDASLGIPVAIIDAGISTIKAAIRAGKTVAEAVEMGIAKIKKLLKGKLFDNENVFRTDMMEGFEAEGVTEETEVKSKAVFNDDGTVTIPARIIRDLVKGGIDNIEDLTDAVMQLIIDDIPDVTHRQVRDFITGYGKTINPSADDISLKIAELKRVGRLLSELEDLQIGKLKTKDPKKLVRITEREIDLKAKIKVLSDILIEKDNVQPTAEEIRKKREQREDSLKQRIADLKERLKNRDFSKKKAAIVTNAKILELEAQMATVRDEVEREQEKVRLKNRTLAEKIQDTAVELISGLPRALVASLDFSATMVQGVMQWFLNPKYSAQAFRESFRQFFSAKREEQFLTKLRSQPFYPLLKASGLPIGETNIKLSVKEGVFFLNLVNHLYDLIVTGLTLGYKPATKIAKQLNPFKASQRAYEGYLNHLRVQVFLHNAKALERQGYRFETDPKVFKQTATNVGTTSGRADLGRHLEGAKFLDIIFFSVRKVVSEIKLFSPLAFLHYGKMPGVVRRKALLDFARFVTGYVILNGAVWALRKNWDDDEEDHFWDPTSSDFLTHNINGTRIGIGSGMKSILVFQARLWSGLFTDQSGNTTKLGERYGKDINSRWDLAEAYVKGKFSPGVAIGAAKLDEKKGRELSDREIIESVTLPMWMQDVKKLYRDHPTEIGALLTALSLIGASVRSPDEKPGGATGGFERPKVERPEIERPKIERPKIER